MRFNRLRLLEFVKNLYPFHTPKDGTWFCFQHGHLTYTEYCVCVGIDDENVWN